MIGDRAPRMRIALVSHEYEGAAHGGGIGTYVRNAAVMLADRGHDVEVFTAGDAMTSAAVARGLHIHTVPADREHFSDAVVDVVARRHGAQAFDVVEGPEYGADAAGVAAAFPELPLVVKLHTPAFMVNEINNQHLRLRHKARFVLGGLRRGRLPQPYWNYDPAGDRERALALAAQEVTAPSRAMLDCVGNRWALPGAALACIPNVFIPPPRLLDLSPAPGSHLVTFLGRLEVRKGVIELARAIPLVRAAHPSARFRFVGRSLPHPATGEDLRTFLIRTLGEHAHSVEFVDGVKYEQVPAVLGEAAVCVFPSIWENFPNVCLEAMAAARGVVGSSAGGMAEILEHGRTGLLVPPRNPRAIARAIVALLRDPERRIAMGLAARAHVTSAYTPDVIGPLQEASYRRAIERSRARRAA